MDKSHAANGGQTTPGKASPQKRDSQRCPTTVAAQAGHATAARGRRLWPSLESPTVPICSATPNQSPPVC